MELLVAILFWGGVSLLVVGVLFSMLCMLVISWDVAVSWAEDWYYDRKGRK